MEGGLGEMLGGRNDPQGSSTDAALSECWTCEAWMVRVSEWVVLQTVSSSLRLPPCVIVGRVWANILLKRQSSITRRLSISTRLPESLFGLANTCP